MEQGMQNMGLDSIHEHKNISNNQTSSSGSNRNIPKSDQPKESIPKQMTWASIASQPAKPQIRVNVIVLCL